MSNQLTSTYSFCIGKKQIHSWYLKKMYLFHYLPTINFQHKSYNEKGKMLILQQWPLAEAKFQIPASVNVRETKNKCLFSQKQLSLQNNNGVILHGHYSCNPCFIRHVLQENFMQLLCVVRGSLPSIFTCLSLIRIYSLIISTLP